LKKDGKCPCPKKKYDDGSSSQCHVCKNICDECEDGTSCTKCAKHRAQKPEKCPCPDGSYDLGANG